MLHFEWAPLFFMPWALTLPSNYAASWRRYCHRPTDAERCRGSHLALFWHTDFDTTCNEDTATIYRSSVLLHASLSSPCPPPFLPPPSLQKQHVYQRQCRLLGQAAVLHTPQPGVPRDMKRTLKITPELKLGIPRLETAIRGRLPDEGSGDDTKDNTRRRRQGTPTDRVDSPVRKKEAEQPPPGSKAPRCQLSPVLGERLQVASPRSTENHRRHLDINLHQAFGRLGASSRQSRGSASNCPPPRSTEHHRRHLDPPRSEPQPQSSRDRSTPTRPWLLRWREPS